MKKEMFEELLKLDALTLEEFKKYLNNHIVSICSAKGTNSKIIQEYETIPKKCKNCDCLMSKNGHTKCGTQKYVCPVCKNTMSETTDTITYYSKLPFEIWKSVIENLIDGLSIRRIAKKNNISLATSFSLRHKILKALQTFLDTITCTGEVQGDEKFFKINLKGTKPKNMPRTSKKRASSGSAGISNHLVCVLSLKDEEDNLVLKIGGLSRVSNQMLDEQLTTKIAPKSVLTTDSASAYRKFCDKNLLLHNIIPSRKYVDNCGHNLAEINGVHSQLEIWLSKFHGVSTRHLQAYLDWFAYIFMMLKRFEHECLEFEMCKNIILDHNYIKTSQISKKEMPIDLYQAYGEFHYGIFA